MISLKSKKPGLQRVTRFPPLDSGLQISVQVEALVLPDYQTAAEELAEQVDANAHTVHNIFHNNQHKLKVAACWVLCLLRLMKVLHKKASTKMMKLCESNSDYLFVDQITMKDHWVHNYHPDTKLQSKHGSMKLTHGNKGKSCANMREVIVNIFQECRGALLRDFECNHQTIAAKYGAIPLWPTVNLGYWIFAKLSEMLFLVNV